MSAEGWLLIKTAYETGSLLKQNDCTLLTMLKLFPQICSEKPHYVSKNSNKNCLHKKTYKTFPL